ncbi:hypothetical protein FIBSPDRAFT_964739 [Athelia psychrophila]|uniref:Uncharacterized protein n=1 Tax=Athelia psychrophila TaxID=1759441 RepID=A0A165XF93_9AGAM|nr:hypothetical protein FIBSPDRAFT_964739 [Fibularhizoctonia sp. CBS 109695]
MLPHLNPPATTLSSSHFEPLPRWGSSIPYLRVPFSALVRPRPEWHLDAPFNPAAFMLTEQRCRLPAGLMRVAEVQTCDGQWMGTGVWAPLFGLGAASGMVEVEMECIRQKVGHILGF